MPRTPFCNAIKLESLSGHRIKTVQDAAYLFVFLFLPCHWHSLERQARKQAILFPLLDPCIWGEVQYIAQCELVVHSLVVLVHEP